MYSSMDDQATEIENGGFYLYVFVFYFNRLSGQEGKIQKRYIDMKIENYNNWEEKHVYACEFLCFSFWPKLSKVVTRKAF